MIPKHAPEFSSMKLPEEGYTHQSYLKAAIDGVLTDKVCACIYCGRCAQFEDLEDMSVYIRSQRSTGIRVTLINYLHKPKGGVDGLANAVPLSTTVRRRWYPNFPAEARLP